MPKKSPAKNPGYPAPVGPYAPVRAAAGTLVFVSGQIPLDPQTGEIVRGGRKTRITRAFRNLLNLCRDNGIHPNQIVKVTVFLTDISAFAEVNEVMTKLFHPKLLPARALVGVNQLPKGADVEVEAVACPDLPRQAHPRSNP